MKEEKFFKPLQQYNHITMKQFFAIMNLCTILFLLVILPSIFTTKEDFDK